MKQTGIQKLMGSWGRISVTLPSLFLSCLHFSSFLSVIDPLLCVSPSFIRGLCRIRWFHSEYPLTGSLHSITPQIYHHFCFKAYRICVYSTLYCFKGCHDIVDHLVALWYLESVNKQFSLYSLFSYFYFFVVLMKGHKINGMCERDEKSKGVKKTGKLGWRDEGWGVRTDETCRNGEI